jgi:hypothetical protein
MKYLKKFENYHQVKVDEILDKISKSGMNSLTQIEKDYLDAFGKDDKMKMLNLEYESGLKNFVSTERHFEFIFSHMEDFDDEGEFYYGTITVPDIEWEDGKRLDGTMEGYILVTKSNDKIPCFEKNGYDILDFCNGLEYEFDNFLDYVIETLNDEKNSF